MENRRAFVIVIDSLGVGSEPKSKDYGDVVNKEKLASEMARPTEYAGTSERKK